MRNPVPFNIPYISGNEVHYIQQAIANRKLSGDGLFTAQCHDYFATHYQFEKSLLTTSCTDALELCALLIDVVPGDEIIIPSYTFVSTANAFALRGATLVFADSSEDSPNIDVSKLEALITPKTKAIVCVHYAGVACEIDALMALAYKYSLYVIEDAAHGIDAYYNQRPLGSLAHLAAFSFHETKNINCGEGGMLVINHKPLIERAEIIWRKGTNQAKFLKGEIKRYEWVAMGSSFMPNEMTAAFLLAQLEQIATVQRQRKMLWETYEELLKPLHIKGYISLPQLPTYATNNAHMFYFMCSSMEERDALIRSLKAAQVKANFHYSALHQSLYFKNKHDGRPLPQCEKYSDCLLRLPLYFDLTKKEIQYVTEQIIKHFEH